MILADGARLYAYDAASLTTDTPVLRWQKLVNTAQTSSVQIKGLEADADGNLYLGTITNEVISYTPSGTQRWKVSTTTSPYYGHAPFSMVLDSGRLFVESQDEGLQAYDLATGRTLWDRPADLLKACPGAPTSTASYLVAGGGKVYAGLFGGDCLPAYNEADGSLAWSFTPAYRQTFLSRPTYVNGVLYATNGRTYALGHGDGSAAGAGGGGHSGVGGDVPAVRSGAGRGVRVGRADPVRVQDPALIPGPARPVDCTGRAGACVPGSVQFWSEA